MLIEHLKKTFEERVEKNPAYSLRAFARSLGMDSSTVSALLRGKRPLSLKTARRLVDGLQIKDPLQAQALIMATFQPETKENPDYSELSMEVAEAISSWHYFAILALLEIKTFKATDRAIAVRLNIPLTLAWESLMRLEKLGLITKGPLESPYNQGGRGGKVEPTLGRNETMYWRLTGKNMATPSQLPSRALREGHKQNILKALESLENDPIEIRDISGITMAISKNKLNGARRLIRDFRLRLSSLLESNQSDSVYRLNIQLFPLSKEGEL